MFDPQMLGASDVKETREDRAVIDPHRLLGALRRGHRWVLLGAVAGALLGVVGAKTCLTHCYMASSTLVRDPTLQGPALEAVRTQRAIADLIKMPSSAAEVRKRLALPLTIDELEARIDVVAATDSSVVTVHGSGESPVAAARLTDTFITTFLELRQNIERQRLGAMLEAANGDQQAAEENLHKATASYAAFRAEHGLVDLAAEQHAALERNMRLRLEAELADAEAEAEHARQGSLTAARAREPFLVLLSQRQMSPAAGKLSDTLVELASAKSRLSNDHPHLLMLQAETDALRRSLGAEPLSAPVERTLGTNPTREAVQTSLLAATAQEAAQSRKRDVLSGLSKGAHAQVTDLGQLEGESSELQTRIKTAEAHFIELQNRRTSLEEAIRSPGAGFQVAARAVAPDATSSARRVFFVASTLLSALLATLIVLARAVWLARSPEPEAHPSPVRSGA